MEVNRRRKLFGVSGLFLAGAGLAAAVRLFIGGSVNPRVFFPDLFGLMVLFLLCALVAVVSAMYLMAGYRGLVNALYYFGIITIGILLEVTLSIPFGLPEEETLGGTILAVNVFFMLTRGWKNELLFRLWKKVSPPPEESLKLQDRVLLKQLELVTMRTASMRVKKHPSYLYEYCREERLITVDFSLYGEDAELLPYRYTRVMALSFPAKRSESDRIAELYDKMEKVIYPLGYAFLAGMAHKVEQNAAELYVYFLPAQAARLKKKLEKMAEKIGLGTVSIQTKSDKEWDLYYETLCPPKKEICRLLNLRVTMFLEDEGIDLAKETVLFFQLFFRDAAGMCECEEKLSELGFETVRAEKFEQEYEQTEYTGRLLVSKSTRLGVERLNLTTDLLIDLEEKFNGCYTRFEFSELDFDGGEAQ